MTKEDIKYIEDYLEWVRKNMNPAEVDFEHFSNGMMNCNNILKQGQSLPIDIVSNCSQECEWKADTFDNIGMALTEYCEECGAKRDCC